MKTIEATLQPRDVVKLAFQFQETEFVPYDDLMLYEHDQALSAWFGDEHWREQHSVSYLGALTGFDGSLTLAGMTPQPDGTQKDILGCSWRMGNISHLEDWPLHEPEMGDYRLPGLQPYFEQYVKPRWPREIAQSANRFRICWTVFGLFERAWTLRGFENFLVDLALNEKFAEQLLDHITEYLLQSVDLMAQAPLDSICFTDDHACQRGMIMGADRWRRLFKPRWKRIYERVHHYGLFATMHMCGDNTEVIPDLIEVGLDCMESCQPECMDLYDLKRRYGRDIRFWGGLGAQRMMPFGTPDEIRREIRRMKRELGRGGGFLLACAKAPDAITPLANILAYLEEAGQPRPVDEL